MKIKLTIAYDGGHYSGWQTQKTGVGVQQVIEDALAKIFPEAPKLRSSSRTDTGVHALGMVADVDLPERPPATAPRKLALALNAYLPPDIRIMSAARARANFDARFHAKGKQYRYFIWNAPAMNPLQRRTAWHVARPLDLPAMRSAAALFLGKHDFKSLAATRGYEMKSTVRTLTRCDVRRRGPAITVVIEGDGFLYKMCRGIVGTLAQIGLGKMPPGDVRSILAAQDRRAAGMTAPAHGLTLWKVFY